jgi:hypothetical protein
LGYPAPAAPPHAGYPPPEVGHGSPPPGPRTHRSSSLHPSTVTLLVVAARFAMGMEGRRAASSASASALWPIDARPADRGESGTAAPHPPHRPSEPGSTTAQGLERSPSNGAPLGLRCASVFQLADQPGRRPRTKGL